MIVEKWVDNQGVRLHYLDSGQPEAEVDKCVPLVYVPGMLGSAADFAEEFAAFALRRCMALSLRGRGKSDAPETGYTLEAHGTDIEAVVEAAEIEPFCLMAHSRGVNYALEFAARHPEKVRGMILLDMPASYPRFSEEWVERALKNFSDRIPPQAIRGLQRESVATLQWELLSRISCPVLVMRGGQSSALLNEEMAQKYTEVLSDCEMLVFEDSGHELWETDYPRLMNAVQKFLHKLDDQSNHFFTKT